MLRALYENKQNAENNIKVDRKIAESIIYETPCVVEYIIETIKNFNEENKRPAIIAFDGWLGVDWDTIIKLISYNEFAGNSKLNLQIETFNIYSIYKSKEELLEYKQKFTENSEGFGYVNINGAIEDVIDASKLKNMKKLINEKKSDKNIAAYIVFASGSAIKELQELYDYKFYFDITRQPLLWKMWDKHIIPLGSYEEKSDYDWKEYYYCDYYILNNQKKLMIGNMDYYVEAIDTNDLKLIPKKSYDIIIQTMLKYPIKEVKIFQPGPWGAYRYKDLWNVPGLECNAWNELAGPELRSEEKRA